MTDTLAELVRDADAEQMAGDLGGTFYLVRRLGLIAYWDVTPGLPIVVRRYGQAEQLEAAWSAIEAGEIWEQGAEETRD